MSYAYNVRKKAIKHHILKGGKKHREYVDTTIEKLNDGAIKKTVLDTEILKKLTTNN